MRDAARTVPALPRGDGAQCLALDAQFALTAEDFRRSTEFGRNVVVVIAGIVLIVIGLLLSASPVAAGELSKSLRMVPYRTDERTLRYYRYCGVGIAAVGLLIAIALA